MFFTATLLALISATHYVSALPVEESHIEERSSHCHTILTGHLVGFDTSNTQYSFVTNSANEVAYDPDWKKSKHQLFVNFQQCPNYKDPIGDEDGTGFVGRMYVPALNGCVSNPAYLQSTSGSANYYPIVTSCDKSTSTVAEDELWKYFVSEDANDLNFVYWARRINFASLEMIDPNATRAIVTPLPETCVIEKRSPSKASDFHNGNLVSFNHKMHLIPTPKFLYNPVTKHLV
ncbi:hypothetical protein FRB96_006707 [Tulasnella sp. 330]|nr:hypothetical protein FRB96_006707 [Tulasnella sp. 330]KAG8870023.1 hypothetical protein FRB97_000425 [Tulasnella sp. 331]KAG8871832.1 hypothetical protein FRB98_000466 [Tulasnella sp. 332]